MIDLVTPQQDGAAGEYGFLKVDGTRKSMLVCILVVMCLLDLPLRQMSGY